MNFMNTITSITPTSLIYSAMKQKMKHYEKFKKFSLAQSPETLELLQKKLLLHSFKLNARRIPHYKHFLKKHKVNPNRINSVEDFKTLVPLTDKKNYIFKAKQLSDLCVNGNIHKVGLVVKSSGHSGRQSYWAKSHEDDLYAKTTMGIGLDENFNVHNKRTLFINGFILGSWVAGINFNEYVSWNSPILNVGPDKQEILQSIEDMKGNFDQFVISGYPPFLKELVDFVKENNIKWKKGTVHFFPGAEDFPESWRTYVQSIVKGSKVFSGFGASDVGLLGGMENHDTVRIRQLATKNESLKKALFGDIDEVPMLFQYPLGNYIYTNKKSELIFTSILPDAMQPVINYNLKDVGGVFTYKEMQEILKSCNVDEEIKMPLPFFYYVGRSSGAANFNGFFVYPENIKDVIYRNDLIASNTTGKFRLLVGYNKVHNKSLFIEFQLKKNVRPNKRMLSSFKKMAMDTLQEVNGGYRATCIRMGKLAEPTIVLHKFEEFDIKSKIKNHYV